MLTKQGAATSWHKKICALRQLSADGMVIDAAAVNGGPKAARLSSGLCRRYRRHRIDLACRRRRSVKAANDNASAVNILSALGRSVGDLGKPGKDAVLGHGLINARAACETGAKKA
jgi:hypothetical protein